METYLQIKRTKMVDEASIGHTPTPLTSTMLRFVLVFLIGTLLGNFVASVPLGIYLVSKTNIYSILVDLSTEKITADAAAEGLAEILSNIPPVFLAISLICTATSIIAAVFYCKKFEKRGIASMGIRKGNAAAEYLVGMLIGVLMYCLALLIAWATGSVTVRINPDGFAPIIVLFLIGYIIQGASEELLVRGFFMVSAARDYKPWVAIIFSSLMFAILHTGNIAVTPLALINIFLYGVLMGIYIFKRGSIWGACAIHSFWNFTQGNIFGSYVSGNTTTSSVFLMEYDPARQLANGGAFGLEGGAATTIVLVVAICITLALKTKKSEISVLESPLSFNVE